MSQTRTRIEIHSAIWLTALIGGLALLHAAVPLENGPYGVDASYYYQIATHVMRGDGLVTTASLYLEGWQLPARIGIYPLWPLLLGSAGRLWGLPTVAAVLPQILYVLTLIALYLFSRMVALDLGALRLSTRPLPDAAHLVVALFGLNRLFFASTVHPYTEGLAFACATASFWMLGRFERSRELRWSVGAGLLAALAFLARAQMLWIAVGTICAFVMLATRNRTLMRGAGSYGVAAAAGVLPWIVYLRYVPGFESFTGYGSLSQRVQLPPFQMYVPAATMGEWLIDRAAGFAVMFHMGSPMSYVSSFGIAALLVPAAAIVAMWRVRKGGPKSPSLLVVALTISGTLFLLNLTMYRGQFFLEWLFGWRHGLPLIFLLAVAVPFLVSISKGISRVLVLAVVVISIAMNASALMAYIRAPAPSLLPQERAMIQWMNSLPGTKTFITTRAQIFATYSNMHFHWIDCSVDASTTMMMLERLPIDYVIVYENERGCAFIEPIESHFRPAAVFGPAGRRIFVVTRH